MPFKTFGLSDPLVQGILAAGYIAPTEVQSQVIPAAIAGKDIIGCAQTGTGKTAAFVLPILNRLSHEHPPKRRFVRSLILTPTRELAVQIEKFILRYGRFLNLRTLAVYGGVNIKRQFTTLRRGVDIVVATPGRLLDHMRQRTIDLRRVEVFILDEADRMLDMGFIRDVRKIIAALPKNRQTMLFSATVTPEISSLAKGVQKSPLMIQIGRPRNPIETITQNIYLVEKERKIGFLLHLLQDGQLSSVLVFSRTKHGADRIQRHLERTGVVSVAIHSSRNQSQRERAMDGFKGGKYRVMVATDIAARGIDVIDISHVINFDVPVFPEDYIHRIGRTGRAEATGDAITFVSRDEHKYLRRIEKFIGRDFTPVECPGFTYVKPHTPKPLLGMHRGKFSKTGRKSRSTSRRKPRRRR